MTDWQHGFYKLSADDRRQQLAKARHLSSMEERVLPKSRIFFNEAINLSLSL